MGLTTKLVDDIPRRMGGEIVCAACSVTAPRRGRVQKYCEPCSTERHRARQAKWRREKAPPANPERARADKARQRERGIAISNDAALGIAGMMASPPPRLAWIARVSIPFSYAASKNHIWATAGQGHVYQRAGAKNYRGQLTMLVRAAVAGRAKNAKVWLDILVQKPNHKGDAVNLLDLICDAVKDAIGVDDRWFSVRRIDWQIVKSDPHIFVGVGQEETEDVQACSSCGGLLTLDHFTKNRTRKEGVGRVCRACRIG